MVDFKTLRDNYLKQWHELEFHPAFETFVAPGSVKGYGVYDKISNTFPRNTKRFEIYATFRHQVQVQQVPIYKQLHIDNLKSSGFPG